MKLVIGSLGWEKQEGFVRVDIVPEWADVCCDIRYGIPVEEQFDVIDCKHVLEHIQLNEHYLAVWKELYRLLKPGGILQVEVPHKNTEMAYESWDHCRYFVNNSFIAFYNNPNYVFEGLPQFKFVELHNGLCNKEKTICLTLTK